MSRNLVLAIILLIASSFFWSGNFFSGKIAFLSDLSPFKLSFFRWILALLILLPFTYAQIIRDIEYYKKNILLMTIISILGVTIFNSFTYISLQTTMVINSTLMASVAPVMMIGFSWLIFRTKTTTLQFTGIILSVLGAFAIILKGNLNNLYNLYFTAGDLWMLGAVVSWCLYSVLLKKIDSKTSQLANLEVMIIIGVIFIIPFYIMESFNSTYLPSTGLDLAIIGYVAVFASIVAFFSWNKGVSIIGPNRASLFLHLIPVFSAIWAISFLNEKFAFFHVIGVLFILSGIILSNIKLSNE
jgi:drug/metabolite transporter (DMT)-like permease